MGVCVDPDGMVETIVEDSLFHQSQLLYPGFVYLDKKNFNTKNEYYFCRRAPENLPRGFAIPHAIKEGIIRMTQPQKDKVQIMFNKRPIVRPNHAYTLQRVSFLNSLTYFANLLYYFF